MLTISERLRIAIQRLRSISSGSTASASGPRHGEHRRGVCPEHGETVADLWRAANQALLDAKRTGKNRIVSYQVRSAT